MILSRLIGTADISNEIRNLKESISGEISKDVTNKNGTSLLSNLSDIPSLFKTGLTKEELSTISAYNSEFDRLSIKAKAAGMNISDHAIAQKAANNVMENASDNVKELIENADDAKIPLENLTGGIKSLWSSMSTGTKIGIIIAATTALVNAIKWAHEQLGTFNTSVEETKEDIEKLNEEYSNNESLLNEINGKLKENEDRIKELNALDALTYVEETELEKLKTVNDLLNEQKTTLEEMQKAISEKQIKNLAEDFYNTYESNNAKANEVHQKSWNILNWLNPSMWGDLVEVTTGDTEEEEQIKTEQDLHNDRTMKNLLSEGKIEDIYDSLSDKAIESEMERLRKENPDAFINMSDAELYNQIMGKTLRDNGFKVSNDRSETQAIFDDIYKYLNSDKKEKLDFESELDADIVENEDSLENTLAGYYERLKLYEEHDPNFEHEDTKNLLAKIDALKKKIDPEKWEQEKYDNIYTSNEYEDFIVGMRQKIADGVINSDTDIFEAYGANLGQIAAEILGEDNEENRKKIASNIFRRLMEGIDGEGNYINKFSEYFNSSEFEESKEKLMELAKAGELTPAILDTEEYNSLLGKTGLLAEEAYEEVMKLVTANERLADMSSDLSPLANAYKEFKEDGFASAETINSLEKFKDLDSYDDFTYTVGSSETSATEKQDAFNTLVTEYMNREQALGKLTEATKDYYITQLKAMGISNAEEVVTNKLTAEKDALALKEKYLAETGLDLFSTSKDNCQAFLDEKDAVYDVRWELFRLNAEEKIFNESELDASQKITELKELAEKYSIVVDAISGINEDEHWRDPLADNDKIVNEAREEINEDEYKIKNAEFEAPDDSGSDAKSSADNIFDWIETRIQRLQRTTQNFMDSITDYASRKFKKNALTEAIASTTEEIKFAEKAYDKYMAKANEYAKKLPKGYVTKVQDGTLNIEEIQDETLRENIENYQKWYEKALEAEDNGNKLKIQKQDQIKQKYENEISKYTDKQAKWDYKQSYKEADIEYKKSIGKVIKPKDYKALVSYSQNNVKALEKERDIQQEYLDTLNPTSVEYQNVLGRIRDINTEIKDAQTQQQEWNDEIANYKANLEQIRIDRLGRKLESMQSNVSIKEAKGLAASKSDYKNQINNSKKTVAHLKAQNEEYKKQLKGLDKNSDKYIEIEEKIHSNNQEIKNATQSQIEWNKAIEDMKIDRYEKMLTVISRLKSNLEGLSSLIESHGNLLDDGMLNKQYQAINREINVAKLNIEAYRDEIGKKLTDGTWAKLTGKQLSEVMKYVDSGDAGGLKKYFESLGIDTATLTEFYEDIAAISQEESNIWSAKVEQENLLDQMIQNRIEKLNEEKEALQKINEAKQKAIELEKLQAALQKARDNKTNLIYREGIGFTYEADQTAVKEAQDALDDYYWEEMIGRFDDIAELLEDWKDDYNLYDDNGNLKENWTDIVKELSTTISTTVNDVLGVIGISMGKDGNITSGISSNLPLIPLESYAISSDAVNKMLDGITPSIVSAINSGFNNVGNIDKVGTNINNTYSINIDKVDMSGIQTYKDAEKFINHLEHIALDATQYVNKR